MLIRHACRLVPALLAVAGFSALAVGQTPKLSPTGVRPNVPQPIPVPSNLPAGGQRLTQPVVAGPDGVKPLDTAVPLVPPPAADVGTPPGFAPKPTIPPPSVSVDPPVDPKPDPKPLTLTPPPAGTLPPPTATVEKLSPGSAPPTLFPPTAVAPKTATIPAPAASPGIVLGETLPNRAAPTVTVEIASPETVGAGQPLTYEVVVRNGGTAAVSNVRVENELPGRCTLVGTEPQAETNADRLAWAVGSLDAGAEKRLKVTVKPNEEGDIRSRATVTFASSVDARVKVTRPRVSVAVTAPEAGRVGETVPLTIQLSNRGTGPAAKVLLRAELTAGLSHAAGQVIEAEIANLAAGETRSLTLDVVGAKAGAQACSLTASADGTPADPARVQLNLVEPLLAIKATGPAKCLVRGEPVYAVELSNPGTAATDPLTLWAALPEGFELVSASDEGAVVPANKAIAWKLPGLPAGSNRVVTLKVRAVGPTDGAIRWAAQTAAAEPAPPAGGVVAAGLKTSKPLQANAETAVHAEGVPGLRFEVAGLEGAVEVSKEAVYEIKLVNLGTAACTNVTIVADLPSGSSAAGASGPTTGRSAASQITFDALPTLGVKGEAVYKVRVRGAQPGDQRIRVRVACDQVRTPIVKEESTRFYKE